MPIKAAVMGLGNIGRYAIEALETDLMAFSRLVTQYENTLRAAIRSTNEPALEAA